MVWGGFVLEKKKRESGGRTTPSQLAVPKHGHFGIGLDWKIGGGAFGKLGRHKSIKKKRELRFFLFFGEASNAALVFDSLEHHVVSGHREKVRGNVGAAL